jgi:hypothetical protein
MCSFRFVLLRVIIIAFSNATCNPVFLQDTRLAGLLYDDTKLAAFLQ